MRVLVSISARYGSKGVPGKNIRKLAGLSLIERAIATASNAPSVTDILISSDSDEILSYGRDNGCILFKRPSSLADDHTSLHDVTKYNLGIFEESYGKPDCIVQYAPTSPFLSSLTIENGITQVLKNGFTSSISLQKIDHSHPYRARILTEDGSFRNFVTSVDVESARYHSRQDLPEMWCTSGGLYIRDYNTMKSYDGKSFGFGSRPYALRISDIESINIDSQADWDFAVFMAHKLSL